MEEAFPFLKIPELVATVRRLITCSGVIAFLEKPKRWE
jgi:hypothetical protein